MSGLLIYFHRLIDWVISLLLLHFEDLCFELKCVQTWLLFWTNYWFKYTGIFLESTHSLQVNYDNETNTFTDNSYLYWIWLWRYSKKIKFYSSIQPFLFEESDKSYTCIHRYIYINSIGSCMQILEVSHQLYTFISKNLYIISGPSTEGFCYISGCSKVNWLHLLDKQQR